MPELSIVISASIVPGFAILGKVLPEHFAPKTETNIRTINQSFNKKGDSFMKQLTENEVSISSLVDVFQSAFMKVSEIEDNKFSVKCETVHMNINVDNERKFIKIMFFQLLDGISYKEAALIANKINNEKILVRFTAYEYKGKVGIFVDYTMSYEEGLIAFQLVNNTKWVERILVDSILKYFNDYL